MDDTTYSLAKKDPVALSAGLTEQYKVISQYMAANKLVIDGVRDKGHS